MSKYTPPSESRVQQLFDIAVVVGSIFVALWFPLYMGWVGNEKVMETIANPTWESLKQTPAQVEQWVKLGFTDAASAHDIIQNRWEYSVNWKQLGMLAFVLISYFVFLFRASDREYRDVIDEKFGKK